MSYVCVGVSYLPYARCVDVGLGGTVAGLEGLRLAPRFGNFRPPRFVDMGASELRNNSSELFALRDPARQVLQIITSCNMW